MTVNDIPNNNNYSVRENNNVDIKTNEISSWIIDDRFLVRFLRVKKFSIPMAEQVLLKYLNFRKRFKHIMYDMDCLDEKVNELVTNGY